MPARAGLPRPPRGVRVLDGLSGSVPGAQTFEYTPHTGDRACNRIPSTRRSRRRWTRWSNRPKRIARSWRLSCAAASRTTRSGRNRTSTSSLVTIDDRKLEATDVALNADGINVHAFLMPRAEFRKTVEGSVNNSFFHSFLAKGRLSTPTIGRSKTCAAGCTGQV
jgi:hypothetical protein